MIVMNDFAAEPPALRQAILGAVARVLESGWYILGDELKAFEREWAQFCGTARAVGVANGTDAIEIALRVLNIGTGDEVITTPMTAFATVLAIIRAGATPVLADVDPTTGLLSIESANRCLSTRTKAVVVVHLYGQLRDMADWERFSDRNGIVLIEDCAQAHGAMLGRRVAGSFGRIGTYSFYPTKNLGAPGDAGALVTNDTALADRAARFRNYGQSRRYQHTEWGMNSRLDELHAAILLERLKWLENFTAHRQRIARQYFDGIRNPVVNPLAPPAESTAHVFHLFVVTTPARTALQAHLRQRQIETLIHYPTPIHHQQPCRDIRRDPGGLPMSERHASSCVSLPCHPQMSDGDVEAVIAAVNEFRED